MTSHRQLEKTDPDAFEFRWLNAINTAAALLLQAAASESDIFDVFHKQISSLDLRGDVVLLVPGSFQLTFAPVSQPGAQNLSSHLVGDQLLSVGQVDLFHQVIEEGESIFLLEAAEFLTQLLSEVDEKTLSRLVNQFGSDPTILVPLTNREAVIGLLYVAGCNLTVDDLPPMKVFAGYISAALSYARLVQAMAEQEHTYRSLFHNLPIGVFRVNSEARFIMANPHFLEQFQISDFDQIKGRTINSLGLKPNHDRQVVIDQLEQTGEVIGYESEWVSESGDQFFFKENIKSAYGPGGELLYYEGSVEDITKNKQTEGKLNKQLDDLQILNRVAAINASAKSLDDLLEQMTELIGDQLFPDHFGAVLWDPSAKALQVHPSYRGVPDSLMDIEIQPGEGIAGRVFETGLPMMINDTGDFPEYIQPGKTMGSELCVPIKTRDTIAGVLNAEREITNGFSREDEILLLTIADQLAVAMDKTRFFDAVERQALQLSLLNKAVLNTSRVLDPNELIKLIAVQIKELFNPDSFVVTLADQAGELLEVAIAVTHGKIDEETTGAVLPIDQGGLSSLVIETGEVLHVDDLEKSPLIVGIKQFQSHMVGSWVGVPLISGDEVIGALAIQHYDKKLINGEETQFLKSMASHAAIAITNGRIFANIKHRFDLSNRLAAISESLNKSQSLQDVIGVIGESSSVLMDSSAGIVYQLMDDETLGCVWSSDLPDDYIEILSDELAAELIVHPVPVFVTDTGKMLGDSELGNLSDKLGIKAISLWPLIYEGKTIAVVGCLKSERYHWLEDEQDAMMTFTRQAAVSMQNARLLAAERNRRHEAEALFKTTKALTSTLDIDDVLDKILVELYRVVDYTSASIQLIQDDVVRIVAAQGLMLAPKQVVGWEFPVSNPLILEMKQTRQPIIVADALNDNRFSLPEAIKYVRGWIGVPLVVGEKMIGCLTIESDAIGSFDEGHAEKAIAFANQAAIAIETARLFGQTQRRLEILQSIHAIDQAISRSMDLSVTFEVFMEQAINLLRVDIVRVFTYEQDAQFYELTAERNLLSPNLLDRENFYDAEMVQKAIGARKVLCNNQLQAAEGLTHREFACYSVAPLTTRGRIRGVMEVFHAARFTPNEEWLDLLNTLATQAAIAIENHDLLTSLKRSNEDLVSAYDRTLEGWAYALELRDRETVGHSRRVTEMTVRLARLIGITGAELANIRRGTLLHDIGKMGLPDSVLLKKGPLTAEEEEVMKTHPQLAYDMLVSIPYLRNALEIPYYHHEKWDGTGYPHGLKGEEIPLAARIFAVVDVWDAVVYDRPYREAWTRKDALVYIKEQSGIHFDPKIVEKFLEIIENDYEIPN